MTRPGALVAVALGLLTLLAPATAVGAPQTTLGDLEDEVMCPICGTLLELSEAPQAERQRVYIGRLIAEGKTKEQIKDALVTQYGREVLAVPRGSGFDLSAYLVPVIAFLVAIVALAFGVLRWRRVATRSSQSAAKPGPGGEEAERLEVDLSHYDL
jgi:cytochrome c-type biogenesis protein CcmH